MHQVEIIISGIVQGVNYRYNTREAARKFELVGWVRNESDGSVKIIAQGEKDKLEELIEWCKRGSDSATIEDIKISWTEINEDQMYEKFEIEY